MDEKPKTVVDQDAVDATAASRTRSLYGGAGTAILSRGIAALAPLIIVPLALSYLGEEVYGVWMTVVGMTAMAAFADLGLGFGLMTKLAGCYARNDSVQARKFVSSAYAALVVLSTSAIVVLWVLAPHIPWGGILNVKTALGASASSGVAIIVLSSFIVTIPLGLIVRVQYAYQRVAQSNLWQAGGSLLSVVLVVTSTRLHLSPLAVVASSAFAVPAAYAANSAWFFTRQMPELAPRLSHVDREQGLLLMRLGGVFFLLTAIISLAVNADNFILARTLGPGAVAQFSTVARLFGALGVLVSLVNVPLWPTAGDALARGDLAWVRKTTRTMTRVSFLAVSVPGAALILFGHSVMRAWIPQVDYFTSALAIGMTIWWASQSTISPRFMVQNSAAVLSPQLLGWSLFALISLPLKWYAAGRWGVAAVPIVGTAVYLTTVVPGGIVGYRRAMAKAGAQ